MNFDCSAFFAIGCYKNRITASLGTATVCKGKKGLYSLLNPFVLLQYHKNNGISGFIRVTDSNIFETINKSVIVGIDRILSIENRRFVHSKKMGGTLVFFIGTSGKNWTIFPSGRSELL